MMVMTSPIRMHKKIAGTSQAGACQSRERGVRACRR